MTKLLIIAGFLMFTISTESPPFAFDKTVHDFGEVPQGEAKCEFKLYNTGNKPIVVSRVNSSCGCLVFSWPKEPIVPGDSGILKARMNTMHRMGTFNKSAAVYLDDKGSPVILHLKGSVTGTTTSPLPSQK